MQRITSLVLAVAVVVAVFAREAVSQQAASDRIAFLDVRRVFRDYTKRKTVLGGLQARTDALKQRIEADADRLDQLAEEMKAMNQDSDDFRAKRRELATLQAQIQFDQEDGMKAIQADASYQEGLIYMEIVQAARQMAEMRGFGAVLQSAPLPADFAQKSDIEIVTATRTVVWSDPARDLTNDLIQQLNGG